MKTAADFRFIAREALRGKWRVAILTGFVACLTGAAGIPESVGDSDTINAIPDLIRTAVSGTPYQPWLTAVTILLVAYILICSIIGGATELGYDRFNLKLVDGRDAAFSDLFSQMRRIGSGFCLNFLIVLFTMLWSLLLVVPGIVKSFSYAMSSYILAENPDIGALEAITESRRIMQGNKWRLFCLWLSFIGWKLLCSVPMFIAGIAFARSEIVVEVGKTAALPVLLMWLAIATIPCFICRLFLQPYVSSATAAFYRDISKHT